MVAVSVDRLPPPLERHQVEALLKIATPDPELDGFFPPADPDTERVVHIPRKLFRDLCQTALMVFDTRDGD